MSVTYYVGVYEYINQDARLYHLLSRCLGRLKKTPNIDPLARF